MQRERSASAARIRWCWIGPPRAEPRQATSKPLKATLRAVRLAVEDVRASDEFGDIARLRPCIERQGIVDLLDAALVHDRDAVRRRHRLGLVVGDVDRGDAEFIVQAADLAAHLLAQIGVEVRQRFVQQQDFRLHHQRARQRHPLLLAAGEFVGIARGEMTKLHHVEDLPDPAFGFVLGDLAHLQAEGDVLLDRHVRPQRVALEDHRHPPLLRRQRGAGRRHLLAVHFDRAGGRRHKTRDHPQRRGLAAAGRAEQRDEFARAQRQIEIVDDDEVAELLGEAC